ncbi:hypothetical protein F511_28692 [Dorcoceras hygrometricum]|uniref:Embryo defective 1703 n=1 Tax=Dorcoceras hygrometricum TaxID=472368 RepID=A0A2Z7AY52_9LAMI|nr:hypothetical protein F511_28692 [Dorcoceras hygrometricum]
MWSVMEFLNSTVLQVTPRVSPTPPFLSLRRPSASSRKLYIYRPLSIYIIRPTIFSNKLEISAHSSRPTNRRNYLRKKLIQHRQFHQVRPIQVPVREFRELENVDTSSEQGGNTEEQSSLDYDCRTYGAVEEPESKSVKKQFGWPILLNELEGWVDQYKKDSEFWGIGTGHIFTVFLDSEGKVERVVVNEDEITRRSAADPRLEDGEAEDLAVVNYKISFAKDLAKEMESGSDIIRKNSSVAKFVLPQYKSGVTEAIRGVMLKPSLPPRMARAGVIVLCGLFVVWSIKNLFFVDEDRAKHTMLEKGISRRNVDGRKEIETMMTGNMEVIQDPTEPKSMSFKRPQLDKDVLLNSIIRSKGSKHDSTSAEYSRYRSKDFEDDVQQIRTMASHAREIEKGNSLLDTCDDENDPSVNAMSTGNMSLREQETAPVYESYETITSNGTKSGRENDMNPLTDDPDHQSDQLHGSSLRTRLRIIKSVKEAREYLSRKHHKLEINREPEANREFDSASTRSLPSVDNSSCNTIQASLNSTDEVYVCSSSMTGHDYSHRLEDYKGIETVDRNADSLDGFQKSRTSSGHEIGVNNEVAEVPIDAIDSERESNHKMSPRDDCENDIPSSLNNASHSTTAEVGRGGSMSTKEVFTQVLPGTTIGGKEDGKTTELSQSAINENWIEKNFHELEPLSKRIAVGFRDNYVAARERSNNGFNSGTVLDQLKTNDEQEFEWMKDERLREIVFKVRDNELSGRDPFYLVNDEDKYAFFSGLEKKVELENEKLIKVHEYFHENIENLDYGADGISLYDPPEKIIPRWKVSPAEKNPEFLKNFVEERKALVAESLKNSCLTKNTGEDNVHKTEEPSSYDNNQSSGLQNEIAASSKTVITGSDGSVKAGKKSGREYWQHTKKWSEGFVESYNAETDPEVKAVMKDIGKDLDRWITEKEIKEAADFMDRLPEEGQKLIRQKLEKVKREMELFGPQAVVSKYREYSEEKEEDYLWWLDLPLVLCIELYTMDNGEQKIGFYSLEMGADLDLDPKQYHVIAFEDVGDCKNLCYIIQAHMEMLGNGNAFVVSRPSKDAFREAKENGFGVTVVRKGQLQLNIDQTLEEVEEIIVEIGSKIYHDKIMKERAVDIEALMKGVFGINHPAKRKKKRRVKP